MDAAMDSTPLDDLVNQAEQLTAEFSSETSFPRVERNLKQLAEAGQQLWSRTALHAPKQTSDVRASVLLGTRGYDLQKVSQKLNSLSDAKKSTHVETITEADTQGFLKNERENAILSVVEEVKKSTLEAVEKLYWERLEREWSDEKLRILNALAGPDADGPSEAINISRDQNAPSSTALNSSFNTPQEEERFVLSVWNEIHAKKNVDHLLGYVSDDGCRIPGRIDQLQANSSSVIENVAKKCEQEGFFEDAIRLYDLAFNHNKVINVLNKLLRDVIASKHELGSERDRLENMALKLAERYTAHGHRANKELMSTFFLLLDLMTFFSYYHKQTFNDALDTIEKLKVIPLRKSEIDHKVNEFNQLPEDVKHNISEILLATMNILYAQYKEAKTTVPQSVNKFGITSETTFREQRCHEIREKAHALITYVGMIPYRMPGSTNAKIIQLEVLMH